MMLLTLSLGSSLTAHDIASVLERKKRPDTLDMRVETLVRAAGQQVVTKLHLVTKGPEKVWMEMDTPMGLQRIVRNGGRYKLEDVRSGKVEYPTSAPDALGSIHGQFGDNAGLFRSGKYQTPKPMGKNQYALHLVPGSDTTSAGRTLIYDAAKESLIRYTEISPQGDTVDTRFEYGDEKKPRFPKRIFMEVRNGEAPTQVEIRFLQADEPKNLGDALFQIP